jgi:transcriptional regulator with XRE-family HTH domain
VDTIKDPIGENLRRIREDRKLSVPQLSAILQIKQDRIYKWEQGKASPKYQDRLLIEQWMADENWINLPDSTIIPADEKTEPDANSLIEALSIIRNQTEFLQQVVRSSLASLSSDVHNNTAAIRAEIRGYAHRQILKEVEGNDEEFLKAKAEADKIYLLNLKQLLGGNKPDAGS